MCDSSQEQSGLVDNQNQTSEKPPTETTQDIKTPTSPTHQTTAKASVAKDKVQILLKNTGSTPMLARKKWNVPKQWQIGQVAQFVKKNLKMEQTETLFLYVKQTFAPSADVEIGTLYDCFGSGDQLVLHYCVTEAWG